MRWFIYLCVLAFLLAGCAGTGPSRDPDEQAETDQGPLDTDGSVRHEVDNRAVAMLWDQAEEARRANDTGEAIEALERALRLAPEDPVLWSRLAEMRLRQKDFAVAENLAAKSNALAGDRRLLRYRNWLLIAEARSRRGDEEGAGEARQKAEELRSDQAARSLDRVAEHETTRPDVPGSGWITPDSASAVPVGQQGIRVSARDAVTQ